MKAPTNRQFGLLGLGLIALANAIALGGVAWNRGGVDSRLVLGERELRTPYSYYALDREDSGVALDIEWSPALDAQAPGVPPESRNVYADTPGWLRGASLAALGFRVRPPAADADRAPRLADRPAWLVLEFDGPAHRRHIALAEHAAARASREMREAAHERLQRARERDSRLYVVAAGPERSTLRSRYPDRSRYAIVEGIVAASWSRSGEGTWALEGRIERLRIPQVQLSRAQVEALGAAARPRAAYDEVGRPFRAVIAFGRRAEPWIESVTQR